MTEKTAIQDLEPESFEAHGYQGGTEARRYEYDLAGDYSPEEPVSEKDAEQVKELLQKAGINADVQSREDRYQGIVIHTDAGKEEVEKVLGGMIETMGQVFGDFEDAMEQIVDEGNALFSQDPEEQKEAVQKLNQMMQKHFPVGVNGTNGIESIQGIIDDEDFNDAIEQASKENSDLCMRPMIMDYVMSKDPQLASRLDTGDMKKENAPITFEDIKPYVSMYKGDDGKQVYDVLDKHSKSAYKTSDERLAQAFFKKNYNKLREAELEEGIKEWGKRLAMAGVIVAGLAGFNSINDAIDNSVPAVKAMNTALEMAQDAGNDELAKMIEKDLSAVKVRLSSGKDLNFVKGMQDKYAKFMKTEGLAYESKLMVNLKQRLK